RNERERAVSIEVFQLASFIPELCNAIGDAISQQYAGTIAMKGDYTRTGERTMNGMMRDGVSSMNRYYLRFRELARQAAIDLFLGHDDSPELVLFRSGAGLKSASLQVREENFKTLIHRCRDMLLKPEEKGLSECLLITYSELHFDPQFVNTLLIVTDQYLHFIR
ncbi:Phosphatidylinositide phosphatase SAC2, partial [Fasciola gigantica]